MLVWAVCFLPFCFQSWRTSFLYCFLWPVAACGDLTQQTNSWIWVEDRKHVPCIHSDSVSLLFEQTLLSVLGACLKLTENGNTLLAMSLGRLLRRASSKASDLLTLNVSNSGSGSSSILDGEIIYSKNNVCVHPPEMLQGIVEHHPGKGKPEKVLWYVYRSSCLPFPVDYLSSHLRFSFLGNLLYRRVSGVVV